MRGLVGRVSDILLKPAISVAISVICLGVVAPKLVSDRSDVSVALGLIMAVTCFYYLYKSVSKYLGERK